MNAAQKAIVRTHKFVNDHKVAIAVITTATTTVAVMEKLRGGALRELHEFLGQEGLEDKFVDFVAEKTKEAL